MPLGVALTPDLRQVLQHLLQRHRRLPPRRRRLLRPLSAAGPAFASAYPSGRAWAPATRVPGWRWSPSTNGPPAFAGRSQRQTRERRSPRSAPPAPPPNKPANPPQPLPCQAEPEGKKDPHQSVALAQGAQSLQQLPLKDQCRDRVCLRDKFYLRSSCGPLHDTTECGLGLPLVRNFAKPREKRFPRRGTKNHEGTRRDTNRLIADWGG